MKYDIVNEGKARIKVPKSSGISSEMPVFYNPVMKSNRDITVALMTEASNPYGIKKWRVADPMAATGIRGIRMLLEVKKTESISLNDYSKTAANLIRKNLRLNGKKAAVTVNEANKFLLASKPFNYIDIDPFGYPGIFLDAAVKRLMHNGILAITATDTSALAGAAQAACKRKYMATPLRNGFMHETGVRILIRLAQLIGAMHEKALTPVFSYYKEHYIRTFLHCREGAGRTDKILSQHKAISYCFNCCERNKCACGMIEAGPLWAGKLFDESVAKRMADSKTGSIEEKTKKFLKLIAEEAEHEEETGPGFYTTEEICRQYKIKQQPPTQAVIDKLRTEGYAATKTHCTATGIKTNASASAVAKASIST